MLSVGISPQKKVKNLYVHFYEVERLYASRSLPVGAPPNPTSNLRFILHLGGACSPTNTSPVAVAKLHVQSCIKLLHSLFHG